MNRTVESAVIRRAAERGHADHGWLETWHTFSFADYFDPAHVGFRSLRVINEDVIAPGQGFPLHPHRDMEIFTYVLEGALAHEDSLGHAGTIRPGVIQVMSAGRGIRHSERNPSKTDRTHLLQVWIEPRERGLTPRYTDWQTTSAADHEAKTLLISGDGRDGSASIAQDADVFRVRLQAGSGTTHQLRDGRGAWLQVVRGALRLNGTPLTAGDGASTEDPGPLTLEATRDAEALLFDLA
ncbi:MAG: pirin family protein [Verrucomicrobia bacterium]|nr:pirin family protein [Verrucomicrobiota bacterium]